MATSVMNVAKYILEQQGIMTNLKLQKLVYFSQAWHLVWEKQESLFDEPIEAWMKGPVVPALYYECPAQHDISAADISGDSDLLTDAQRESIDAVLDAYAGFSGEELSNISRRERPWKEARNGIPAHASSDKPISNEDIWTYYSLFYDAEFVV